MTPSALIIQRNSAYYKWYSFHQYPDVYEAWWGIDTLPNVNENEPEYTDYICGKGGVLEYWMSLGAAGFRLDVADELPDAFLDHLHDCVKRADGEHIIIGEVWEDASTKEAYGVKRRYLLGNQLDSVMNYPFRTAIMNYVDQELISYVRELWQNKKKAYRILKTDAHILSSMTGISSMTG